MTKYGYMDGRYLRSIIIEDKVECYVDDNGQQQQCVISEEEQISKLPSKWKPVQQIDQAQIDGVEDGFVIVPTPYDFGDYIGYKYTQKRDVQAIHRQIVELKQSLAVSDYKIIKCYEASLLGHPLPYDISELHLQRQQQRDKINVLEDFLL